MAITKQDILDNLTPGKGHQIEAKVVDLFQMIPDLQAWCKQNGFTLHFVAARGKWHFDDFYLLVPPGHECIYPDSKLIT